MNLIRDPWIPVRHRSGRCTLRSPAQVVGEANDPVVAVASPRADLDGGIVQLLIGLLQAVLAPRDEDEWTDLAEQPPGQRALSELLEPLAPAFELLGPGPRFLQDARVVASGAEPWPIEKLLIDLGLSQGSDLFARNGSVGPLCLPCAAAALATLQTSAPAGGRGNLTSLRGGGPLTTLVVSADAEAALWTTLWLNVLPLSALNGGKAGGADSGLFPWMQVVEPGEPSRPLELTPDDVPGWHAFFGMPRRLWLGAAESGACGLCGRTDEPTVSGVSSRPNGIRYTGAWIHPLSPYRRFKETQWLAVKGYETGLGYRHWLGLAVAPPDSNVRPALPVRELLRDPDRFRVAADLRLWAFGYAMDNMRAKAWSEGLMPLYQVPPEIRETFAERIRQLVEGAELGESYLRFAFKKLVARRPQDVKRQPSHISARFWERTEVTFYDTARDLLDALANGVDDLAIRQRWYAILVRAALNIFELEVSEADFRAADPRQVARAWNELRRGLFGKKFRAALGLPADRSRAGKAGER